MKNTNATFNHADIEQKIVAYKKLGFGTDQIKEIRQGLLHGIDVSEYADKDYYAIQMRQIRIGLEKDLDVSLYESKEYDWFQMEEIRLGLEEGLDAKIYAKPDWSYEVMRELRKALKDGIHLEDYAKAGAELLGELHQAILDKKNILPYIKAGYVPQQLKEIRHALNHGCDINPYLNTAYRGIAIKQIWKGLEKGLDVRIYAKPEYSWQQMREIRLGLERRLDVSIYAKELYSWQQMREIRLGMESKLDIDVYKSLMYSAADMHRMRLMMREQKLREQKLLSTPHQQNQRRQMEEYCSRFVKDTMRIILDPAKLFAYIYVGENAQTPTRDEIQKSLDKLNIRTGINYDVMDAIAEGQFKEQLLPIAEGKAPEKGEDGYYEYFFEKDRSVEEKMLADGTIDYDHIEWFQKVHMGQTIAIYHQAGTGTEGLSIEGNVLPAIPGKEMELLKGRGFRLLEDGGTYISEQDGCLSIQNNHIVITQLLELDEVSTLTGSVDYNGSIHIKGDVRGDLTVHAMGDIAIDGFVEGAVLEANGDIFIRKGTNGSEVGKITTGGSTYGRFFENVSICAENIRSNYFFRCDLYATHFIRTDGKTGGIAGGDIYAGSGIDVNHVGNRNGIVTLIKVGLTEKVFERDDASKLKEADKQIAILENALEELKKKFAPEVRNAMPAFLKIENAIYTKKEEKKQLLYSIAEQEKKREKLRKAYLNVAGTMYEGTIVQINDAKYESGTQNQVLLKNEKHNMTIQHI